jgi:hypothetical protein
MGFQGGGHRSPVVEIASSLLEVLHGDSALQRAKEI